MKPRNRPTIIYSAGCKFCRWVVRNIVSHFDVDIIPSRDVDADKFFPQWDWDFAERIGHWHYDSDYTFHNVIPAIVWMQRDGVIPKWLSPEWLEKLDRWVKSHRYILSKFVPDGPAYKRIGNQYWWLDPYAFRLLPVNGTVNGGVIEGFPEQGLEVPFGTIKKEWME